MILAPFFAEINRLGYYQSINQRVGEIINVYNETDAALNLYRLNQASKPDNGPSSLGAEWSFKRNGVFAIIGGIRFDCPSDSQAFPIALTECDHFYDQYFVDVTLSESEQEISFSASNTAATMETRGRFDILSYIIPVQSDPLGTLTGEGAGSVIGSTINLNANTFDYTNSNYDHSAQFLSDYSARKCFWENLLDRFDLKILQDTDPCKTN